jgi:hypothetical protein
MRVMFFIAVVAAAMLIGLRAIEAYYGNGPWCAVESVGFSTSRRIAACAASSSAECRPSPGTAAFAKQEEVVRLFPRARFDAEED